VVRGLGDAARSVVVGNAYAGKESSRHDIDELAFGIYGLRAALSRSLAGEWRGSLGLSYEHRGYDGPDSFFGITRKDRQFEVRVGAERAFGARLSVTPQIIYTRNASTLAPSDFRRTQALVAARYRF
jgi:hypothetical protein